MRPELCPVGRTRRKRAPGVTLAGVRWPAVDDKAPLAQAMERWEAGDLAAAERLCLEALDKRETGHARHLLGIVAAQAGRLEGAQEQLERARALLPDSASIHDSLGNVLHERGRAAEAIESYRAALSHDRRSVETHRNLALVLAETGALDEAASHLETTLALRPDYVDAYLELADILVAAGQRPRAFGLLAEATRLAPSNTRAWNQRGALLASVGRLGEARAVFAKALAANPQDVQTRGNLASALMAENRAGDAAALLLEGWQTATPASPERTALLPFFVELLTGSAVPTAEAWTEILTEICRRPDLSAAPLAPGLAAVLAERPVIAALAEGEADPLGGDLSGLADPLLIAALDATLLPNPRLERALTRLRRALLGRHLAPAADWPNSAALHTFSCALARYCFLGEYAFFVRDDEAAQLRTAVERWPSARDADPRTCEAAAVVLAMYLPLSSLDGADQLAARPAGSWTAAFARVHEQQLLAPRREQELRATIPSLGAIDDDVSQAVRQQYEENPYPRWVRAARPRPRPFEALARQWRPSEPTPRFPRPVSVLVAGCGTGHEVVQMASAVSDSEVLAVDLSLASLAYAARMAERLGLEAVRFLQADILDLARLEQRFALITCSGVLHHLRDPLAGWRVLTGLLKPHGLMKVGLYSALARRSLAQTRSFLHELALPATAQGIRQMRHAILELPEGDPRRGVVESGDFYSLSACRDLLLHTQEHLFSVPRIAEALDRLGLRFLGFETTRATAARFQKMFPRPEAALSLEAWHKFEEAHPITFARMYQFWCCAR